MLKTLGPYVQYRVSVQRVLLCTFSNGSSFCTFLLCRIRMRIWRRLVEDEWALAFASTSKNLNFIAADKYLCFCAQVRLEFVRSIVVRGWGLWEEKEIKYVKKSTCQRTWTYLGLGKTFPRQDTIVPRLNKLTTLKWKLLHFSLSFGRKYTISHNGLQHLENIPMKKSQY